MDKNDAVIQHFKTRSINYNDPRRVYLRSERDFKSDMDSSPSQVVTRPNPQGREKLTVSQRSQARHNVNYNMYSGYTTGHRFGSG